MSARLGLILLPFRTPLVQPALHCRMRRGLVEAAIAGGRIPVCRPFMGVIFDLLPSIRRKRDRPIRVLNYGRRQNEERHGARVIANTLDLTATDMTHANH